MKLKENNSPLVSNNLRRFIQFLSQKKGPQLPEWSNSFLMTRNIQRKVCPYFFLVGLERHYYNREEIELYISRAE